VAHAFNPSTYEAEAGRFLSSRPAWSTKLVPGQPGLYRETLSRKTKQTKKKKKERKKKEMHTGITKFKEKGDNEFEMEQWRYNGSGRRNRKQV
jgi:hypothetical protein